MAHRFPKLTVLTEFYTFFVCSVLSSLIASYSKPTNKNLKLNSSPKLQKTTIDFPASTNSLPTTPKKLFIAYYHIFHISLILLSKKKRKTFQNNNHIINLLKAIKNHHFQES